MAQLSERGKVLDHFALTETSLQQLLMLDYDDALWRIDHETKVHVEWAKARRSFIKAEMDRRQPKQKRKPTTGLPIVSHRNRTNGTAHVHGERYG